MAKKEAAKVALKVAGDIAQKAIVPIAGEGAKKMFSTANEGKSVSFDKTLDNTGKTVSLVERKIDWDTVKTNIENAVPYVKAAVVPVGSSAAGYLIGAPLIGAAAFMLGGPAAGIGWLVAGRILAIGGGITATAIVENEVATKGKTPKMDETESETVIEECESCYEEGGEE